MKKKTIIFVILAMFSVVFIAGVSGVVFLVCNAEIVMNYFTDYHYTSEKRLLRYLDENYSISFPQSMTNVKVAEAYTGFDGSSTFILKFHANSDETNDFLMQFGEISERFKAYTPEADKRVGDKYPEWFKSPIEAGQIGNVHIRGFNVSHLTDVYIDMSNKSEFVIYMEGVYKI